MGSPRRRMMDVSTRDWVMQKGGRQEDTTHTSNVLFLILLHYNSSPVLPGLGSKFHLIDKVTDDVTVRCEKEVERCLRPLTATRKITNLVATAKLVQRPQSMGVEIDVAWNDSKGQRSQQKFTLPVGR